MFTDLKNKKVLLVGLGLLGGAEETAKFLLKQGAKLTITDLRDKKVLKPTVDRLKGYGIKFVLGEHIEEDFKNNDIIFFNQAVPAKSPWVKYAKKIGKPIKSDITLFLENIRSDYIGVTGTRGKTTVSFWINHFLKDSVLGGNIPNKGLIKIIKNRPDVFVLELSSFQLEYMAKGLRAPKVAAITNLYNDHLNRYKTLKNYSKVKSNIFLNQAGDDYLVLNADDSETKNFLKQKPKAKKYFVSLKPLNKTKNGLFFDKEKIYFQEKGRKIQVTSIHGFEDFQKSNLLVAMLCAYLYEQNWKHITSLIKSLPSVLFRQETVFENKNIKVVNDSVATSPDAAGVAVERFSKEKRDLVLVSGGTDKNLDFKDFAKILKNKINPENLFLLEGSATEKMVKELVNINYFKKNEAQIFENFRDILKEIKNKKHKNVTVLLSPASASFEKFDNEFDRGHTFNKLAKEILK